MTYLTVAIITHLIGIAVYMKKMPNGSWPFLKELWKYYTDGTEAALVSVGTFSIVWVLGSIYIDKLQVSYFSVLIGLPCHPAIAALLGFVGEFFGPKAIKAIFKWAVPGGDD
jgi:hypothetical protein